MNGIMIYEGDIVIENGSMAIGNVDEQIGEFVLLAAPGEFKEVPIIGMNVKNMLNGNVDPFFAGKLKMQLKSQHLKAKKIVVNETDIAVEI